MIDTIMQNIKTLFSCLSPVKENRSMQENFRSPYIIRDHLVCCKAYAQWGLSYFSKKYGKTLHEIRRNSPGSKPKKVSLDTYINQYILSGEEELDPYYLTSWQFLRNAPKLNDDLQGVQLFENWTDYLAENIISKYESRLIFIGKKGAVFNWHYDSVMVNSCAGVLTGSKLWIFVENKYKDQIRRRQFDFISEKKRKPVRLRIPARYALQKKGDLVVTPAGWLHYVINIENSISFTQNFINASNINKVINYLGTSDSFKFENASAAEILIWKKVFRKLKEKMI